MFRQLWIAIPVFLGTLTGAQGADSGDPLRQALEKALAAATQPAGPTEAARRYYLMPETVSPDGVWGLGFEAGHPFGDCVLDMRRRRVVGKLSHLNYFDGRDVSNIREELFVAWTPDSRRALAICAGRIRSTEIVWMEPAARKFSSALEPMEDAFSDWLEAHGEGCYRYLRFSNPAMIGPAEVVLDGATHVPMRDGRTPSYRLKARLTTGSHGTPRCQILAVHRLEEGSESVSLDENAVMFGYFQRLQSTLSPKAQTELEEEQKKWAVWMDAQPEDARGVLTAQRTALLRARMEFGP